MTLAPAAGRRRRDAGAAARQGDGRLDFAAGARGLGARARRRSLAGRDRALDGEAIKLSARASWPRARSASARVVASPGTVLRADGDGLVVACGDGAVAFGELQLPGRKRLPIGGVLNGHAIEPGTRLG